MHPANLAALSVARPDVCVLANNHVGDFGRRGLVETLEVLARGGLRAAGAGRDAAEASRPAVLPLGNGRRVLVFAVGTLSSGIPPDWAPAGDGPGVALTELTDDAAEALAASVRAARGPSDTVVVSIHWGSNWGDDVPGPHRRFAHRLVDNGIDLVHGHSSHHPRAIEIYRGRLILYGCGDLVDDYEGIGGHERYRPDLRLLYLARLDSGSGRLVELRMAPMQARRLRLHRAGSADIAWLARTLTRVNAGTAPPMTVSDGALVLHPPRPDRSAERVPCRAIESGCAGLGCGGSADDPDRGGGQAPHELVVGQSDLRQQLAIAIGVDLFLQLRRHAVRRRIGALAVQQLDEVVPGELHAVLRNRV